MDYNEAKTSFIQAWGTLGSSWGINKTMAQIHALLLISEKALSTEEIMEELKISRGNANMNIRALMDWELVNKQLKPGERKEYFMAEKEVWEIAKKIGYERRRKEIGPLIKILEQVSEVEVDSNQAKEFKKVTKDLHGFSTKVDSVLQRFQQADQNWFLKRLLKL